MVKKCCKLPKSHKWKLFFIEWSSPYLGSCSLHVDHILPTTPSPLKDKYSVRLLGKGFKNGNSMDGGLMGFELCKNQYLVKNGQTKVDIIIVINESECSCSRGLPWHSLKQLYSLHLTTVLEIIFSILACLFQLLEGKQKSYKIPYFSITMHYGSACAHFIEKTFFLQSGSYYTHFSRQIPRKSVVKTRNYLNQQEIRFWPI